MNHAAPAPQNVKITQWSQLALAHITRRNVPATPENYAIFYHAASGQNIDLIKEIDNIDKNGVPFSTQTSNYLYKKFIISERNSEIIHDAAASANRLLGDVLRAVGSFGAETTDYNKDIDNYMERIAIEVPDANLQGILKEVLEASAQMRQQGQQLTARLEKSKGEIEALKQNLEQVTNESQKDFLTGIFNRKAFDRFLDEKIDEAKHNSQSLCLLMLDIDHFKQFNDNFGHLLGDEVLKLVAKSLTDCVRGADIVARYGGEEFAVILPDTPTSGAVKVAETIRQTIAKRELKRRDSGESYGKITVSIGVGLLRPTTDGALSLIKRADDALYQSKHRGRNRVTTEAS